MPDGGLVGWSLMSMDLEHMVHFRCRPSSSSSMLMLPSQVGHTVVFRLMVLTIMISLPPCACPAARSAGNGSHERRRETPPLWVFSAGPGPLPVGIFAESYCSPITLGPSGYSLVLFLGSSSFFFALVTFFVICAVTD